MFYVLIVAEDVAIEFNDIDSDNDEPPMKKRSVEKENHSGI